MRRSLPIRGPLSEIATARGIVLSRRFSHKVKSGPVRCHITGGSWARTSQPYSAPRGVNFTSELETGARGKQVKDGRAPVSAAMLGAHAESSSTQPRECLSSVRVRHPGTTTAVETSSPNAIGPQPQATPRVRVQALRNPRLVEPHHCMTPLAESTMARKPLVVLESSMTAASALPRTGHVKRST